MWTCSYETHHVKRFDEITFDLRIVYEKVRPGQYLFARL